MAIVMHNYSLYVRAGVTIKRLLPVRFTEQLVSIEDRLIFFSNSFTCVLILKTNF